MFPKVEKLIILIAGCTFININIFIFIAFMNKDVNTSKIHRKREFIAY